MKYEIIKGSEKDFEGAPEWARLVVEHCEFTYNTWFYESDKVGGKWKRCKGQLRGVVERDGIGNWLNVIAERRPITEPVVDQQLTTGWDGEGLPPVGVECEFFNDGYNCRPSCPDNGTVVKIVAHQKSKTGIDLAIFTWTGEREGIRAEAGTEVLFRPITSPKDIEIGEITQFLINYYAYPKGAEQYLNIAKAFYDAGYRKCKS